jgi:hypothetical protein
VNFGTLHQTVARIKTIKENRCQPCGEKKVLSAFLALSSAFDVAQNNTSDMLKTGPEQISSSSWGIIFREICLLPSPPSSSRLVFHSYPFTASFSFSIASKVVRPALLLGPRLGIVARGVVDELLLIRVDDLATAVLALHLWVSLRCAASGTECGVRWRWAWGL